MPTPEPERQHDSRRRIMAAIDAAKRKNARLQLMKERHAHYLAERREEEDQHEDLMDELTLADK